MLLIRLVGIVCLPRIGTGAVHVVGVHSLFAENKSHTMMKSLRCNPFNARVNSSTLVPGARHVSMSSDWKPQRLAACPCRQLGNLRDSPRVHVVSLETSGLATCTYRQPGNLGDSPLTYCRGWVTRDRAAIVRCGRIKDQVLPLELME